MKVLVTGATSLLGREVVARLRSRGDEVRAFQRRPGGLGVDEALGDVADADAVRSALSDMDAVVHLAARVSVTGPWSAFESTNVVGTGNVVREARRAGVERLVHVSSPSVAHAGVSLVGVGAAPADPEATTGGYARSKAMAEEIALAAAGDEMSIVALRPHLVWGPGDEQLVGRIVDRARAGRLAIVGSGAALVDTTYVDNAAAALVCALDRAPRISGRALVVSNGQPRPIGELIARIVTAAGLPPPSATVPALVARLAGTALERWWAVTGRGGEPPMTSFLAEQLSTAHWFDQRETRRLLGWEPEVGLEEGFRRLGTWFGAS